VQDQVQEPPEPITTALEDGYIHVAVGEFGGIVPSLDLIGLKAKELSEAWLRRNANAS
tara:strand:- start:350 stop:523 length:174 start_codon:yes stop_codon:yes gene_type:complete